MGIKPPPDRACKRQGCGNWPSPGATVCRFHGGRAPQVARKAQARLQLMDWKLGDAVDDPVQTLLRQITQSRQRCDYYASLLNRQVDEADDKDDAATGVRIPAWVAGLIGHNYAAAGKDGDLYATGEGVRALVELERMERKMLTDQCRAAIQAGIAERVVAIAEQQGALLVQAMQVMVAAAISAGMDERFADVIFAAAPGALRQIEAQPTP